MKKKLLSLLLAGVMVTSLLAGCGSKDQAADTTTAPSTTAASTTASSEQVTLEFYHGYFQNDWNPAVEMRKIYDEFAKNNPGFKAVPIQTGSDGVKDKVISEFANGSFPSMVDLAGTNALEAAVKGGLVMDLKPVIDADAALKAGVGKVNYEQNQVDGKIYTVRDQIETQGFWYNEAIFKKANAALPDTWKSWDDFAAATKKIRDAGFTPFILEESSSQRLAGAWMGSTEEGRKLLGSLPESFDNDALRKALTAIGTEVKANGQKNISAKGDAYRDDFFKGSPVGTAKVAICFNGVWDAGSAAGSVFKADIKPATFPAGDNDAAKRFSYASAGAGYAISNKLTDGQKELAIKFLKYMMSDEVQTKIITLCEANPASDNINYDTLLADKNTSEATIKLIEACKLANGTTYKAKTLNNAWGNDIAKGISDQMLLFPSAAKVDDVVTKCVKALNSLIQ